MHLFSRYPLKNGSKTFRRGEVIPAGTFDDRVVERLITTNQAYMESRPLRSRDDLKAIARAHDIGDTGSAQVLTDRLIAAGIDPWLSEVRAEAGTEAEQDKEDA